MDGEDRYAEIQVGHIPRCYKERDTAARRADSWLVSFYPSKVFRQVDIYEEGRPARGTLVAILLCVCS